MLLTHSLEISFLLKAVVEKCMKGETPTVEEAVALLKIDCDTPDFYHLCWAANWLTRRQFDNKGDVCAQIGLDFSPCSKNCGFCAFGRSAGIAKEPLEWEIDVVLKVAKEMVQAGANAVYLMTTADYPFQKYVTIAEEVRKVVPNHIPMVANIGDFTYEQAVQLKRVGFTSVYHALRLREGIDTAIKPERRKQTIANAKAAGLAVQVCLEPVGPEHTAEEMVEQMFWAREVGVTFNGAMRRTAVAGSALAGRGEISYRELAKIVAVARLVMGDTVVAHCTHEPNLPSLMAGANLIWAEAGPNPRDTVFDTSRGRGWNVVQAKRLLWEAGYEVHNGPSRAALTS